MKAAIVVLSDPNANSEEALGRVFNGLATAYELKQTGDEVTVVFQGAGTRWLKLLSALSQSGQWNCDPYIYIVGPAW